MAYNIPVTPRQAGCLSEAGSIPQEGDMQNVKARVQPGAALALGLVFLAGVGLRLYHLGAQGLFLDEAWSWAVAQLPAGQIVSLSFRDPHPVLYYFFIKATHLIVPDTAAGLRLFSVACSLASLAIVMYFARRWWGVRAAFFAGLCLALATFDVYYAQEARMYTLLAFFWLLSFASLAQALRGHHRYMLLWGGASLLLGWTQFYGLLYLYAQLAFLCGLWLWQRVHRQGFPVPYSWLAAGIGIALIGTLPELYFVWLFRHAAAGGAWVASPQDLVGFVVLTVAGLSPARAYFLDGDRLVLPLLAHFPFWGWAIVSGLVLIVACLGLFSRPRLAISNGERQQHALALWTLALPAFIFLYSLILQRQQFALKPFLGIAYILYLYAGLAFSRLPKWVGAVLALGLVGLCLISMVPYTTTWQKIDSQRALGSIPDHPSSSQVLLERSYLAPIAFFYLPANETVWGFRGEPTTDFRLVRITPNGILSSDLHDFNCQDAEVQQVSEFWVYDSIERLRAEIQRWPACLAQKRLHVFDGQKWVLFSP